MTIPDTVRVLNHPALRERVTQLRTAEAGEPFARVLEQIGAIMAYETLAKYRTAATQVSTPCGSANGTVLVGNAALVPILRAGEGLLTPFRSLRPRAKVWHLGLSRDERTLLPSVYMNKVPKVLPAGVDYIIVLDVMLATGGSAAMALDIVERLDAEHVIFIGVLAAPEGIAFLAERHPKAQIILAQVDSHLNDKGYIVPGLGDAGDKLFPID